MNPEKLLWYVNRLRSMQGREILHRISEAIEVRRPERSSAPLATPTYCEGGSSSSLLVTVWSTFSSRAASEHCKARALNAIQGSVSIFGHPWSTTSKEWNVDPVSGYEWPSLPAHRIDYRHSTKADPKWTWEINRLLFLLPVAFAVEAGEVNRNAGEEMIRETISDWIRRNRAGHGPQWAASIEVAIRAIVMTLSLQAINTLNDSFSDSVARSIAEHVAWIKRFPSLYSSANNHRIAEVAALLILSSLWDGVLTDAETAHFEQELVEVSSALFSPDGIGLEQSPTYAGFTLEFLALVLHSYHWMDDQNHSAIKRICASAAYAISQFTNDDGSLIRYGDDDEGKVVTVAVPDREYASALIRLATGDEKARRQGVVTFAQGGLSVMRFADLASESTWVFDHGPLGFGDIAAHGHADALSVSLRFAGIDWIVDAGTYRYHGDKFWRSYFRSSRAHNAPQLDDRDSSVMTGDFNWDPVKRAVSELQLLQVDGPLFRVQASHDGYTRQGFGPISRTVERKGEALYQITDTYRGKGTMTTGFLLNPDCRVVQLDDQWRISHPGTDYQILLSVSGHSAINTESPTGESAWFSPSFGVKVPTWRLVSTSVESEVERQLTFNFVFSNQSPLEA